MSSLLGREMLQKCPWDGKTMIDLTYYQFKTRLIKVFSSSFFIWFHFLSYQFVANDVGRGCFRMDVVASHFSDCYHVLKSLINTKQEGILNRIVRVSQISKFRNER